MSETVAVHDVLHVLKAHKVTVTLVKEDHTYIVEAVDFLEEIKFTPDVGKRRLQYLARKLDIPIHLFWHPEMCPAIKSDIVH